MTDQPNLRDRAIDAVGQALGDAHYWLPVEGRPIAVDAVLALISPDAGYCPHCGRGDCAPTADEYEAARRNAVRIQQLLDDTRDRMRKLAAGLANGTHWDGNEPEIGERIIAALHQPTETPDA